MDANRKLWNRQQKALRLALISPDDHQEAIELFLSQHAMIYTAKMSRSRVYSFEDEILEDMTEDATRFMPSRFKHSIAWIIWHLARIEDVTMNLLVAGGPQVLHGDPWLEQMKIKVCNTGNGMDDEDIADLSSRIDIGADQLIT